MPKRVFRPRHTRIAKGEKRPKAKKPVRPSIAELRDIMKGLVTTDEAARFAAISAILQWYDKAFDYVLYKEGDDGWSPEQVQAHHKAIKARTYFISGNDRQKRMRAGRVAIRQYEVVCSKLKPPCVDEYFYMTPEQAQRNWQSSERAEEKFAKLIHLVNDVLKPENYAGEAITLKIASIQEPQRIDAELRSVTLRRDIARLLYKSMHVPRGGILPMVLSLMPILSRACAMYPEVDHEEKPTGRFLADDETILEAERSMLGNLAFWAATAEAPKRLVRLAVRPMKKTSEEKGTFKGIRKVGGEKVAGVFAAGSACAILYDAMKDGGWFAFDALQAMINTDVAGRLRKLHRGGQQLRESGKDGWAVEIKEENKAKWARIVPETAPKDDIPFA